MAHCFKHGLSRHCPITLDNAPADPVLAPVRTPPASRSFSSRIKDSALEKALSLFLRPKLKRYGEIRRLTIDTTARLLSAEVSLHGDPLPLEITAVSYRLQESAHGTSIVLFDFKLSKEWIQHLVDDQFAEVCLPIPDYIKPLID